ncbi:4-alpha-glucanotransferase [Pseudoalteromonas espejiana DSM 9414]|uniref:4-alpha-glucanotransferase n=1 Tax=Pseudoalteromonas espejiana TaxID=28107 RepID=A0A510XRI2_9GAMM|nr:4-alpha-glucanotransferase [Pseudoalteromonas espejiana]ASM52228.1 4-alpha-glucanotransferase [Pseudoalteromonas espejiana DSM 9414]GEK53644.1 4-alpha-glucanotransferase [Pseudoalteromonas espejiana]
MDALSQLFYLHGIGYEFTKYTGEQVIFSEDTRKRALQCCGVNTENDNQVAHLNYELDAATWLELTPNTSLFSLTDKLLHVRIDERQLGQHFSVSISELNLNFERENLHGLAVTGEYYLHDVRYIEVAVPLATMPVGYYSAVVKVGEQSKQTQLWATPEKVYQVDDSKRTGLSIQLYTVKNKAGLGVGDFNDLLELCELCAQQHMDYILLNPLHLLFAEQPERASPYSPNSRALLNPLYISIELCGDSNNNAQLNTLLQSDEVQAIINKHEQFIDYELVSRAKYTLFNALYTHFEATASSARRDEFNLFCEQNQSTLKTLNSANPSFDYYLQWQARLQLNICQQHCLDAGMAIGLINDLAVGCAGDGVEYKSQQPLFSENANVGAPPDPWAEAGQNWGLPALNPQQLKNEHFSFYRALIQSNMQGVGGLRIDHVMALRRLWWCFENNHKQDGCYVYYPFEYLLAILKIESHLNKSIVIGEDLGIVPPEVKHALASSGIYSNSLFYFEKQHDGEFLPLEHLPKHCLIMIANHDVPPFCGWWQLDDLKIKQQYQLIDEQQYHQQDQLRKTEKQRLLRFINRHSHERLSENSNAMTVYSELAKALAHANTRLFALQLDDLDKQTYPVNVPGTNTEYPNWRRVLTHTSKEIFQNNASTLAAINSIRKGYA